MAQAEIRSRGDELEAAFERRTPGRVVSRDHFRPAVVELGCGVDFVCANRGGFDEQRETEVLQRRRPQDLGPDDDGQEIGE